MQKGNEYGQYVRELRRKHNHTLSTMGAKFGVSVAFLSAIEVGDKKIPVDMADKISEMYNLTKEETLDLKDAIYLSNDRVTIELEDLEENEKKLVLAFNRIIKEGNMAKLNKIEQFLGQ